MKILHKTVLKNIVLSITLLLLVSPKINAQQIPHYTQYLYNMQILNPAYVGYRSDLSASVLSRQQWVGIEGAPETSTFSVNGRTKKGLGLGLTFVSDKIGLSKATNTSLDVSYTLITSQRSRLALGLKGSILFFDNNVSQAITPDNDTYNTISGRFSNIGFGAMFYTQKYFVGFSIPTLFDTPLFRAFESNQTISNKVNFKNYFLSGGVLLQVSEDIIFKPSALIKHTQNLPLSVDVNTNFLYKNIIEAGLSYRYNSSISALFAVIVNEKIRIGYAYDKRLSNLGTNLNSHEIVLQIDLNFNRSERWLLNNKCYF